MIRMKRIEKWSLRYLFVKRFVYLFFRLFYRNFTIKGLENIPKNKPVILAPNHQNALMDALTIVFSLPGQPIFLSRADIFKNKIAAYILTILKLMPVYRIRDGKESLVNNQDTFDSSIGVLESKKVLCLFPEGAHIGIKSMLPHKKAIPRIAFLAGEKTNFDIDLQVIPVGLYYSHYYNFRSDLVVQYGKPIPLKEYFDIYRSEGELKATQILKDKIYLELSKLCVNVPDKEDYEIYEQAFEIFRRKVCKKNNLKTSPLNLVKAEQSIIQKLKVYLDEHLSEKEEFLQTASTYKKLKNKLCIDEKSLIKGDIRWIEIFIASSLFLISLPFSLFGAILHGWLFRITNYSTRKRIKDPQFYSSFSLAISLISFTFWIIILFVFFTFLLKSWFLSLILVFISIPCGIMAWEIVQLFLRIYNRLKCVRLKKNGNLDFKKLIENRSYLISKFDKILN
jgi:1-acyl-sn-glycerol-3-phosphate acyltransferase